MRYIGAACLGVGISLLIGAGALVYNAANSPEMPDDITGAAIVGIAGLVIWSVGLIAISDKWED